LTILGTGHLLFLSKSEDSEGSHRQFFLRVSPFLQVILLHFLENQ